MNQSHAYNEVAFHCLFDKFDVDGSGTISPSEFKRGLAEFGMELDEVEVDVLREEQQP